MPRARRSAVQKASLRCAVFCSIIGAEACNFNKQEETIDAGGAKQILVNAHVNFRNGIATTDIEQTIHEVEKLIKSAEPKVDMIFLETARQSESRPDKPIPQHIG